MTTFIGGKATAVRVYTATRATLRTPFHAGNHGYTHRQGELRSCGNGAPQLSGVPQCSTGTSAQGLVWGFGSIPRTWELG